MNSGYEHVISRVQREISAFGYKKSKNIFRKIDGEFLSIIEFQKSRDSTDVSTKFTINVGIVWKRLIGVFGKFEKATSVDAHLIERIGFLLDEKRDKWWTIVDEKSAELISIEVAHDILDIAIPYLEKYSNEGELVALWKSGISPGLTKVQCDRILEKILQET